MRRVSAAQVRAMRAVLYRIPDEEEDAIDACLAHNYRVGLVKGAVAGAVVAGGLVGLLWWLL